MKTRDLRLALVAWLLLTAHTATADSSLIISEYGDPSSGYNKYVEIYNALGTPIDLSQYRLWFIQSNPAGNGGYWPEYAITLSGTLAVDDVYVVCHPGADPSVKIHSDLQWNALDFNGNDAVGLAQTNIAGGWMLIDAIGEEGTNGHTVGWSVAGAPTATADHTLIRKAGVSVGTTNWSLSAGADSANSQWIVLPADTATNLGFHGTAPGQPPFIVIEQPDITVPVNSPVSYSITVGDFNNDSITLSATSPGAGELFTPALNQIGTPVLTNTFTWTPDTPGDYVVDYSATDNDGAVTSTVAIHVSGMLPPPEELWINEIDYNNASNDTNEGAEVAGRAGTDLSDYRLVFYNGSSQLAGDTDTLSGTIPDQQAGYGTVWHDMGLQNGAPDGVALIKVAAGQTNTLQFLSYEGSFAAADGPAKGFVSEDIGVSETDATPVGHSLQLTGRGYVYADFTWSGPFGHTRGAVNTNQTFVAKPTLLLIR